MADLSFYTHRYAITSEEKAYEHFVGTLRNYYDHSYYVNWQTVFRNIEKYETELALLSTLCNKPDTEDAACRLLLQYPQVIKALPTLIGCRNEVSILESTAPLRSSLFSFVPLGAEHAEGEARRYAKFLVSCGLIELLRRIRSVPDYATGVEVGMDSNGRKNRSGECASKVVRPLLEDAARAAEAFLKPEATYDYLCQAGFCLPPSMARIKWDWALYTNHDKPRLLVVELNHYGTSGSKPEKTALEYMERQAVLDAAGIGYIWITDGLGWLKMKPTLRKAFDGVTNLCTIQMASEGFLHWNACCMLCADPPSGCG